MEEELSTQLKELNEELSPILGEVFDGVDYKTAIIYFAGVLKNLLEELDDPDFTKIMLYYCFDGDSDVSL